MLEFIDHVLYLLQNGIVQAVVLVLLLAVAVGYYYSNNKEKYDADHPFPWTRIILILLLLGYLTMVYRATFGRSSGSGTGGFSFHLFRSWRDAWNRFSVVTWLNILLNIAMMIPLGVLLPLVFKRCRKWKSMLLSGLGVALYIETMQYFSSKGIFDADDLFNNTLGSMMGFFFLKFFLSFFCPQKETLETYIEIWRTDHNSYCRDCGYFYFLSCPEIWQSTPRVYICGKYGCHRMGTIL